MWPLIVLLLATGGPQQSPGNLDGAYVGRIPQINSLQNLRGPDLRVRRASPEDMINKNTCYTVRSYHFDRQDGNAPVLVGTTTCTPARILEQKRVSPSRGLYVPLSLQSDPKQPQ